MYSTNTYESVVRTQVTGGESKPVNLGLTDLEGAKV